VGYTPDQLGAAPEGANLGLGCGNPQAIAALKPGEVVLDLGSGGGFDCFLAARQVGPTGHVIGVDMTPEMVSRARENARRTGAANVEFRLGEIEHLPVADAAVDVLISNCVINLSPDKPAVLREAFRVLRPGGRVAFSDVVATAPLPRELAERLDAYTACVGGAAQVGELRGWLRAARFAEVRIEVDEASREVIREWVPGSGAERYVASASITAVKPPAPADSRG
jgi:SAM-dependent methyltransferase